MRFLLQLILFIVLFRFLWSIIKKYWPEISDINDKKQAQRKQPPNLKIDKSDIEDAEFTELDEDNDKN